MNGHQKEIDCFSGELQNNLKMRGKKAKENPTMVYSAEKLDGNSCVNPLFSECTLPLLLFAPRISHKYSKPIEKYTEIVA